MRRSDKRRSAKIPPMLKRRGCAFHGYVGQVLPVGFTFQCFLIPLLIATLIVIASAVDKTFTLDGRNVGLLEHPAIWSLLLLQILLPLCINNSLQQLQVARFRHGELIKLERKPSDLLLRPIDKFLGLNRNFSRVAAASIYLVGLLAFVWNTIQNQRPGIAVPFDFWDSKNHFWGFWVNCFYKLYLYGWFLPYMAMLQVGILVVTLELIRSERLKHNLKLFPFHSDGVGGFGFVASLVSTPVIITLLVGSIATAAAFEVHRAFDVTPVIGLIILLSWAVLAYIIPILFLRSDIIAVKQEMSRKLANLEQTTYAQTMDKTTISLGNFKKGTEVVEYLDRVSSKVRSVPNYPHLKRLIGYIGIAMTPSLISLAIKVYQATGVMIFSGLKQP